MLLDIEKAQIMFKLARKGNWKACYDRTEHFKRFHNLNQSIKELNKIGWLILHLKGKFTGISLNTEFKKEIIDFIELHLPHLKGTVI